MYQIFQRPMRTDDWGCPLEQRRSVTIWAEFDGILINYGGLYSTRYITKLVNRYTTSYLTAQIILNWNDL